MASKVKKYEENNASAYCVLVMFWVAFLICVLSIIGILFVHLWGKNNYNGWFIFYEVFILLFNLQLIAPYFLIKGLIKPLQKINKASIKLASGNLGIQTNYTGNINEIKSVFENFNVMAKELEGINTLRSDFVSNVSHQFKTPLAAIEGYALYLEAENISEEEKKDCIKHIINNVKKLSEFTGDILMLSKLENNSLNLEKVTYELDENIRQSLLMQQNLWEAKNITFKIEMEEISYTGEKTFLEHVWSNLISNAVKYSHENSEISIKLYRNNKVVIFEIEDYGIGISKEAQGHIFEKFYQEDTIHKSKGNGLGLAQVREIIRLTGNEIKVKSKKGVGTTFTVILH